MSPILDLVALSQSRRGTPARCWCGNVDSCGDYTDPDAHYYGTAAEIVETLSLASPDISAKSSTTPPRPSTNHCDVLIAGAGTGGTLTGMSRRLREANENVVIVGIDPRGSVLARPETLNALEKGESDLYKVEGIGYDFVSSSSDPHDSLLILDVCRSPKYCYTPQSTSGSRRTMRNPSRPRGD